MQLFHRTALTLSLTVIGAAFGFFGAGLFIRDNAGFAGGAAILMTGISGLVFGAVAGFLAAFYATPRVHKRINLVALPAAFLLLGAFAFAIWRNAGQLTDPETAYTGLPTFKVVFEQTTITDPNLATSIQVDTSSRIWQIVLADGRICTGRLRAKVQESIGTALIGSRNKLDRGEICSGHDGPQVQVLNLHLIDAPGKSLEKSVELPLGCSESGPVIAPLVRILRLMPSIAETKTTCKRP